MKKSTLIMMVSIVLAVALGIGGTLAYLTDTDADVNTMVLGNVQIVQNEQERVKDENGDFTTALQPFTNNQIIYPAVYDVKPNDQAKVPLNVNGYEINIREFPNYVDKMVSVTNTGNSDAYVRTIIAVPQALDTTYSDATEGNNVSESWLHWNSITDTDTTPNNGWYAGSDANRTEYPGAENRYIIKDVEINGAMYTVCVFTNMDPLAPGETTGPCMAGFYLDNNVDYEDGNYVWRDKETGKATVVWDKDQIDILVMSQAVQAQGFDNAYDALNAAFGVVTADNSATWLGNITEEDIGSPGDKWVDNNPPVVTEVGTDEELQAALTADEETIAVALTDDVTYDVAAWQNNAMGGESTKNIIIDGKGNTITFNNTNSDWNNVVNGDAVLTIKNATITNSGNDATSGTWNAHDIVFADSVVLENVVSENAIALMSDATLKNVTITDDSTGDAYGIWIRPNGQTVVIDGLKMDMTTSGGTDRGIKVDNQYEEDNDLGVTLTVKNAEIKTEKKAAILVKSTGNVSVTTENITFTGIVTDIVNVDSAVAANAANILHNGVAAPVEQ